MTLSAPASAPVLAVCKATGSVPKEELLSPRASRATLRCNRSSRPLGARTGSRMFAFVSAPADTFTNTFPFHSLARVPTRVKNGSTLVFLCPFPNTFLPWSVELPALARKRTRPFPISHPRDAALCIVRRGHVLLSDGWVTRAPAPVSPSATSLSQLRGQRPRRRGQTGPQRRRGQRRPHHLLASGCGAPRHRLAYPHLT